MQLFGKKEHLDKWIREAVGGDRKAQKNIYEFLSDRMFAVCLRYSGSREEAEDILQDGFVALFSHLDSYSFEGSFEGWARKVFVNTALMTLRKKDILRQSADIDEAGGMDSCEEGAVGKIGCEELLKLVSELPSGFRTVFNLYVVEGYSHKEIAERLGISEATSRSQLQRARMILQERIGKRH